MGSGYDMGAHHRAGEEEYGDPIYLQKNSTTVQRAMNTLSNEAKWQQGVNNSNDIKRTHLTTYNSARCDMLHIFDELLSKEEENEEKSEEKKEEKIKGKKGKKKEKKKRKEKKEKMLGPHGIRGIFLSAPGSVSELVEHPRTSQQFPNTSNIDKFVLDDKSQKSNSSLLQSISHSPEKGEQRPLDCDLTGLRFNIFLRDPNGMIMQKIEGWDYGNCIETNPWIYLTKLKLNILIKTRTIDVRTKKMKLSCQNCESCQITYVNN
ncbi:unnamed protein product [Rhizophagus irregularis]|nr:unnamed protein product [Rhizophagus irregularis]